MSPGPSGIDATAVLVALRAAGTPYADVAVHDSVGSTNALVAAAGRAWAAVAADEQTAGRGRLGRGWSTPPGRALAVSVLVPATSTPAWLPLATGLAVKEAVTDVTGVDTVLKWPNDVLVPADGDRKLCGILCELVGGSTGAGPAQDPGVQGAGGVVIGVGLNVSQSRDELPVGTATSLVLAGAGVVDRTRLLTAYLVRLARRHAELAEGSELLRDRYADACATIGSDVEVHLPGGTGLSGRATGIDAHGRLVLATSGGVRSVAAGDVVHVRRGC